MRRCSGSRRSAGQELQSLAGRTDLALGDSEFNRQELEALGFTRTGVLPIAVNTARLTAAARRPALERILGDGLINILFVGRIVPNKKIEDHIRLAEVYKRYIDSYYRFVFVGRYDGLPRYYATDPGADRPVPDAARALPLHRPGAGRRSGGVSIAGPTPTSRSASTKASACRWSRRWRPTCRSWRMLPGPSRKRSAAPACCSRRRISSSPPRCSARSYTIDRCASACSTGSGAGSCDFAPDRIDARLRDVLATLGA